MSDTPPDRLSVNPNNKYYDADVLQRGVGMKFKGEEKTNVDEYCVSEGWVRLAVGKAVDRKGNALTVKLQARSNPISRAAKAKAKRRPDPSVALRHPPASRRLAAHSQFRSAMKSCRQASAFYHLHSLDSVLPSAI